MFRLIKTDKRVTYQDIDMNILHMYAIFVRDGTSASLYSCIRIISCARDAASLRYEIKMSNPGDCTIQGVNLCF